MAKQPTEPQHHVLRGVWPVASSSFRLTSMRRPCWATPTEGQDRPGCRGLHFRGAWCNGEHSRLRSCRSGFDSRCPFHSRHKGGTAMTHEEAWIDVDWDLDFASFEWMVHLAACFNRHLPPNAPWNTWPDWPTDMIGRCPKSHARMALGVPPRARHPSIAVKGNTITVTDAHGTARVLEDVDVTCRWWHVDVTSDWNVPPRIIAALDARHGPSASHKFVPGQMEQICMGVEDDALLRPRACLGASDDARPGGLVQQSDRLPRRKVHLLPWNPTRKASGDRGWSTGRKWPTRLVLQHGIVVQLILTGPRIRSAPRAPSTRAEAARDGVGRQVEENFGPASSTAVKGQSFSASSDPHAVLRKAAGKPSAETRRSTPARQPPRRVYQGPLTSTNSCR